jgi:F-type H+-transporting ATPase subunit b
MNLNATLLVEIITFILLIWLVMKFVWPHIIDAMEERKQKIADGLAAADKGHRTLELAEIKVKEQIAEVKVQAAKILEQANSRATHIVEEAKLQAREEGERLLQLAQAEIAQESQAARDLLLRDVSRLAVSGAEKILKRQVDDEHSARLIDELIGEV